MAQSTSAVNPEFFSFTLDNFTPSSDIQTFLCPGVYALLDSEDRVLYIGQSANAPQRADVHKRKKWGPEISRTLICPVASPDERLMLETLLQLRYRPRYCRAIKLGIAKDGTLSELQFVRTRRT